MLGAGALGEEYERGRCLGLKEEVVEKGVWDN